MIIDTKYGIRVINYAGFDKRLGASMIDAILMAFIAFGVMAISAGWVQLFMSFASSAHESQKIMQQVAMLLVGIVMAADVWLFVYLPIRFGGTPGTLFFEHRIVSGDFRLAKPEAIIIRHAPVFFLMLLGFGVILSTYSNPGSGFTKASFSLCLWTWYIWIFGNLLIMALSDKHLTISDVLAGTGIVSKNSVIYWVETEETEEEEAAAAEVAEAEKKKLAESVPLEEKHWTCIYDDDEEYWEQVIAALWQDVNQLATTAYLHKETIQESVDNIVDEENTQVSRYVESNIVEPEKKRSRR